MYGIVFKLFFVVVAIMMVFYAAAGAFRSSRRLDRRIREFKAEQEEMERKGKAPNPYAALSDLYTQEKPDRSRRSGPRRR